MRERRERERIDSERENNKNKKKDMKRKRIREAIRLVGKGTVKFLDLESDKVHGNSEEG